MSLLIFSTLMVHKHFDHSLEDGLHLVSLIRLIQLFLHYIALGFYFGHLVQIQFGHLVSCISLLSFTIFTLYSPKAVKNAVHKTIQDEEYVIVAPTMRFFHWRIAAKSKTHYYVGRAYGRTVNIYDKFEIKPLPKTPLIEIALKDRNLAAFVSFSPLYRWEISELDNGLTEVRLIDLRYRSDNRYPFVAVAHLNDDNEIITSYTGWIFTEDKLQKITGWRK